MPPDSPALPHADPSGQPVLDQMRLQAQADGEAALDRRQLRSQQRQQALETKLRTQREREQRVLANRQAHQHYENAISMLSQQKVVLGDLGSRAQRIQGDVAILIGLLTGSGAATLPPLVNDAVDLQTVIATSQAGKRIAVDWFDQIKQVSIKRIETVTLERAALLQPLVAQYGAHVAIVDQAEQRVIATKAANSAAFAAADKYKNLGMTLHVFNSANGPTQKLTGAELGNLSKKLEGYRVTSWVSARLPGTRAHRTGETMLVPHTLAGFPYQPSSEIFHDWVWDTKPGHGQTARKMNEMLRLIHTGSQLPGMGPFKTAVQPNLNIRVTHPNLTLDVILNANATVLITFFNTA